MRSPASGRSILQPSPPSHTLIHIPLYTHTQSHAPSAHPHPTPPIYTQTHAFIQQAGPGKLRKFGAAPPLSTESGQQEAPWFPPIGEKRSRKAPCHQGQAAGLMITLFILNAALFSALRHKTKRWHLSSVTGTAAAVVKCRGNGSFSWKTGSFSCGTAFSGSHGGPGPEPLPCHSRGLPVP